MYALTSERLREVLHYDPETGLFTWKVRLAARGPVGAVAGAHMRARNGHYIGIRIDRTLYLGHRLAWLYMTGEWPKEQVDHRDLDGTNNRWSNLREATNEQNTRNQRCRKSNPTGLKGASYFKRDGVWLAQITFRRKNHHLGRFATAEEAHEAYKAAAIRLHGEFARVE